LFHPAFSRLQPILQEQENRSTQFLRRVEFFLTVITVPVIGWLIDQTSVDRMLTMVGSVLVGAILLILLVKSVRPRTAAGRYGNGLDILRLPPPSHSRRVQRECTTNPRASARES